MERVLYRIDEYPEHSFLFLTKNPLAYETIPFPSNCWLGVTVTRQEEMEALLTDDLPDLSWVDEYTFFLSIEPILEPIQLYVRPDWLIIGAETGNRKGKVIPERKWIEELVATGLPIFMKDSLIPIWGEDLIRQWPKGMGVA